MANRQPVLFLSHGAPPLADDRRWVAELRAWGANLPKPANVLVVSAHWEHAPAAVGSTTPHTPLVYDFYGFPQRYYEVTYDAPAAPELADEVAGLLGGLHQDPTRGLDHGAYVPLVELFPDADVPVLQLSLPTLAPEGLVELGERLAPLREAGTLIVGSGFTTHNLRWFNPAAGADGMPPAASAEFDDVDRRIVDIVPVEQDLAGDTAAIDGVVHAVERAEERRLAAARGADDGDEGTFLDLEVDVGDDGDAVIADGDVGHGDEAHSRPPPRCAQRKARREKRSSRRSSP